MNVAVIDWKNEEETRCSLAEAARIVCISYSQMKNWKKKFKIKDFNNFTVIFKVKTIKQPRKGQPNYPFNLKNKNF